MSQIIDAAIEQSRQQNETVRITKTEIAQSGCSLESLHTELFGEAEGESQEGEEHHYWGWSPDDESDSWRVVLPVEVQS